MRRYLLLIVALVLALYINQRTGAPQKALPDKASDSLVLDQAAPAEPEKVVATPVLDEETAAAEAPVIPTFFPKAKVISKVKDPVDAQGRQRVIETVETGMKEPYVRVERTFKQDSSGVQHQLGGEVAMVANQLLLEKPDGLDKAAFKQLLKQAGAQDVKEIGEAFLATFAAQPLDPHALDTFMSRVKEVAGADVTVEPNYIRKLF